MGLFLLIKKAIDDLNYVLILDSTEKIETKYIDISDQKNNYLSQIEEVYGYRETDFNKFFVTGTNGKTKQPFIFSVKCLVTLAA